MSTEPAPGLDRGSNPASYQPRHPSRGLLGLGLCLVVVGVLVLLFRMAEFVPSLLPLRHWFEGISLWQLWPLLVCMGGVITVLTPDEERHRYSLMRIVDGLTTIVIGLLLQCNTTGWVSWHMWLSALSLWPLLLIIGGISVVSKATGLPWLRIFGSLLFVGALLLCAAAWWSGPFSLPLSPHLRVPFLPGML
ncbi:MAG: DUF5668 domain-containing protein [Actinomycetes bacterium]|nr:DUF5668 domain-containing protein [Actinomycetes bacterium]